MSKKCPNCRWTIADLNPSEEQRRELFHLLQQNKKLHAVKLLHQVLPISLTTAKGTVMHLHATYGHCVNCNYTDLEGESCFCPQCGSFNYNWQRDGADIK
jgi:uncharacterized paraquat-inducible protein A